MLAQSRSAALDGRFATSLQSPPSVLLGAMRAGGACGRGPDCRIGQLRGDLVRHLQAGPGGHSRYGIDTDALGDEVFGESPREADDRALGGSVVDHFGGATESDNGGGIDDAGCGKSVDAKVPRKAVEEAYEAPFFMWGKAYFVIANIWMMFDWKLEFTWSKQQT